MGETTNYEKHTTSNPIGRLFLNNFLNTVIVTIRPLQPLRILDVGAGEGFTLDKLSKEKIGTHLEGIEYAKEALNIGKKLHPHLTLKQGNIYTLPYKDNAFDLVLCTEVLEHLDRPAEGLKELIRVSQKYVLVTVPNEPWFTLQRIARGKNLLKLGAHPEHIQHWSSKRFEKFVLDAGHSGLSRIHVKKDSGVAASNAASQNDNSQARKATVKILEKKHPFPWTMLLLEKKD